MVTKKRMTTFLVAVGRRVAVLRAERKITQEQLAEKIGSAKPVVSRIERGASAPSLGRLVEIADALGVDVWDLLAGALPSSRDPHAATLAAITALLRSCSVEDGARLLRVARALLAER